MFILAINIRDKRIKRFTLKDRCKGGTVVLFNVKDFNPHFWIPKRNKSVKDE